MAVGSSEFPWISGPESGDDDGGEDAKKIPVHLKKKFFAQRTQSFPKSAGKTHKKTLSNVDRASFNLEKNATPIYGFKDLPYEEKASIFSKRIPSFLQTNGPALTTIDGNVADHLSSENLILRGSKLKNTEFVYGQWSGTEARREMIECQREVFFFKFLLSGCAVYTGADTKLALNSKLTSNKFSSVEKSINKYLLFYLGLLIFMVIVSTALKTVMESKNGYGEFWHSILHQAAENTRKPSWLKMQRIESRIMHAGRSYLREKVLLPCASTWFALISNSFSSTSRLISAGRYSLRSIDNSIPSFPSVHSSEPTTES